MNSAVLQIILALAMFLTTAVAGFIPLKLVRHLNKKGGPSKKSGKWLSLLSCFSGGVFMGTCFLDIIPHINENYVRFQEDAGSDIEFPLPQFFTCIGFFVVYLIEEFCIKIFAMPHDHGNSLEAPEKVPEDHTKEVTNIRATDALVAKNGHFSESDKSIHSQVMEETANYAVAEKSEGSLLKSLTFAVAMSFHSILEGFALGVQDTPARIWTLFLSLILHKGIEAFSVGLQVTKGNTDKMKAVVATILVYALMTPLGAGLGTLLQMSHINPLHKDGAVLILESLAAGTFIYVTFLEVLAHEKQNDINSLKQLFAIFVGFAVIAGLQLAFGGHGHSEHEHHEHLLATTLLPSVAGGGR